MILEGAIGDAYGAGFEFAKYEKIKLKNTITKYEAHPLFNEINGKYTDDTQMAIGISELLIEEQEWTPLKIASKFVDVFKRDPRRGYAKSFYDFLFNVVDGQEFLNTIIGKSERNGAAMRSYPIGVLYNEEEVINKCNMQSMITHNTDQGIISAQAIALMNHYFIYEKGRKSNLPEYLSDIQKYNWNGNWKGEVRCDAIETVEAVLTIILREISLKEMLRKSVDFGGDVDTIASLTLAIGSNCKEVENDLPNWLYKELENRKYGHDYIKNLDRSILNLKIN